MTNVENINKSKYNCRLKQIDNIYQQILNFPYYTLSTAEYNIYCRIFKNVPTVLDITNYRHIWMMLGLNVRLKIEDFNKIKYIINKISSLLNIAQVKYGVIIDHNYNYIDLYTISTKVLDDLYQDYIFFYNIYENIYIQIEEFHRLISIYKINCIDITVNNLNNDLTKKVDKKWFITLLEIYLKYEGKIPVTSSKLFNFLKEKYELMHDHHAIELVSIIDNVLGGSSIKDIEHIAYNFEMWIKRNYDCIEDRYKLVILI